MLFIIFVIFTPIVVWLILHFMSRRKAGMETVEPGDLLEVCAICQNEFPMTELLEKEVGGYGRGLLFLWRMRSKTSITNTGTRQTPTQENEICTIWLRLEKR